MSWQNAGDMGLQVIKQVNDALKIDAHWRIDEPRGFTWWSSEHAQRVWTDAGIFHQTQAVFRLHAEIELLKGHGHAQECELFLSQIMSSATLSALVYDTNSDTFKLHCSVYLSEDNADWLGKLFLAAVGLQVSEAFMHGQSLADQTKAIIASSGHPQAGLRGEPDPMCHAINKFFRPYGQQPSRWLGVAEWSEAGESIRRLAQKVTCDDRSSLVAQFPWGPPGSLDTEQVSVLEVSAEKAHPELGNGLYMSLKLPLHYDEQATAHTAMELNAAERRDWKWFHDIGSWCCEGTTIEFNCFVPNTSYNPKILEALVHEMGLRANWVSEAFHSPAFAES